MAARFNAFDYPDYGEDVEQLATFFRTFEEDDPVDGLPVRKYATMLEEVSNRQRRTFELDLDDLYDTSDDGERLAERVRTNARRYVEVISAAVDKVMPTPTEALGGAEDTLEVLMNTRAAQQQQRPGAADDGDGGTGADEDSPPADGGVPPALRRRYQVVIVPRGKEKPIKLRQVLSEHVGRLLSVKGIVTRCSSVRPLLCVATYTCDQCGFEVFQDITARTFMPPVKCPSQPCETNRTNGRLRLQTRGSKFLPFQEVRVQEEADQVPVGHIPRALTIHCYGETARACCAGDVVTVTGIFLPVPFTGMRGLRAGLLADTYLEAMAIEQHKKTRADDGTASAEEAQARDLAKEVDVYERLGRSIAPEIFAHEDVKKALLLLLVGGVTKALGDGMRIRGDINVCLMGDPGVAKSQLLKHVAQVAPRAVYTTGKGSSGVGLTAAVMRDSNTGEAVLEGGALVLADMGICCIDEFDKMDDQDRTAIHEVMEQQTVSIAKAGITTTLNARTSILAAANPAWSRWNPTKTITENVNLPAALLSRFDLMWLITDAASEERDRALAEHVTYVHRYSSHPPMDVDAVDPAVIRAYIRQAREHEPVVPRDMQEHIVDEYVVLRQKDEESGKQEGFTSARTLLAILRLSQALARVHLRDEVTEADVAEARRLMEVSKDSVEGLKENREKPSAQTMLTRVAQMITDAIQKNGGTAIELEEVMPGLIAAGATMQDVEAAVDTYTQLGVWQYLPATGVVRLVAPDLDDDDGFDNLDE